MRVSFLPIFLSFSLYHSGFGSRTISGRVVVAGATGRLGQLVVKDLLSRKIGPYNESISIGVVAAVRDIGKAQEIFREMSSDSLTITKCDLTQESDINRICKDADAIIWCATGFSDKSSFMDRLKALFFLAVSPKQSIDVQALETICKIMQAKSDGLTPDTPQVVMCSSAGVTRPIWSAEKKERFIGASDIPIVRLNPLDILGTKRDSEQVIRSSGVKYSIVRPCGLNDKWASGRPILSQGDVSVGRINRNDVASLLVDALLDKHAVRKTFEAISTPGLPSPRSLSGQLSRLLPDTDGKVVSIADDALFFQYNILQQLVPGEVLAPNQLAMGQTYEQLDQGLEGRLGKRGTEKAPLVREN